MARKTKIEKSPSKKKKRKRVVKKTAIDAPESFFDIPDLSNELGIIAEKIPDLSTMEYTTPHIFVPTIFTSFNRAIQTGGAPTGCLWLVYGPFGEGKTAFTIGMIVSFLRLGFPAMYVDAEFAADTQRWFRALGGDGLLKNCLYERPQSYESAVERIFKAINNFNAAKTAGKISPDACFIIVLDSINKLVPKGEMEEIMKAAKIGRTFPIRPLFNSLFADKLTPTVGASNVAFVMIAQERDKIDATQFERTSKVKGGKAIQYDSSVMVRVTRGKKITVGSNEKKIHIGNLHRFVVEKNKIGICFERGEFFTSTGKGDAPLGFDLPREIIEEGLKRKIVKKKGTTLYLPEGIDAEPAVGKDKMISQLQSNPAAYRALFDYMNEQTAINIDDDDEESIDEDE